MAGNRTLAIIKPDAFAAGMAGKILAHIEQDGFKIVSARVLHLTGAEAAEFYAVHRDRTFFTALTTFMTSGPCMPVVLKKPDAVAGFRRLIGSTDPKDADEGTIRKLFAESKERNAVHGSDSDENAEREIRFFFSDTELLRAR